jgi:hypothetical protein
MSYIEARERVIKYLAERDGYSLSTAEYVFSCISVKRAREYLRMVRNTK